MLLAHSVFKPETLSTLTSKWANKALLAYSASDEDNFEAKEAFQNVLELMPYPLPQSL